jgi:FSR family fosmidomycin resistance protein-like MFS transporter
MLVRSDDRPRGRSTAVGILAAISVAHLLNDTIQAVLPAIYPMFKSMFRLTFAPAWSLTILGALIFSKYLYLASLNSYYTFFLMTKFHVSVRMSQIDLCLFLAAVAAGTVVGGPVGDRIGRKYVIWASILGVLPFTLMLPHATLFWTPILTVVIGVVLASAFSAIVVYAQELVPHRVGFVSGLFFGLAFGVAGVGAAVLGQLADSRGIETVYRICAFLPAIGVLAAFLPDVDSPRAVGDGLTPP